MFGFVIKLYDFPGQSNNVFDVFKNALDYMFFSEQYVDLNNVKTNNFYATSGGLNMKDSIIAGGSYGLTQYMNVINSHIMTSLVGSNIYMPPNAVFTNCSFDVTDPMLTLIG